MTLKKSILLPALLLCSCTAGTNASEYDLSYAGDGSITAKIDGAKMSVEGAGSIRSYLSKTEVPFYKSSKNIHTLSLSEGITVIGNHSFESLGNVSSVVLPKTTTLVGRDAFDKNTDLFMYSQVEFASEHERAYIYTEEAPSEIGNYWHFDQDMNPVIWREEEVKMPRKTLFIGNSFTFYGDIPNLYNEMAKDLGFDMTTESVTVGSHTLTQYANPNDSYGSQVYKKLRESDDYTYIVLQEQSTAPLENYNAFAQAVATLKKEIDRTQKNCTVYLYSTWGYQSAADARHMTIPQMEAKLSEAYGSVGGDNRIPVTYVGKAFSKIYDDHKEINLYHSDNKHPGIYGSYLSACCHISSMLKADVTKTKYNGELPAETEAQKAMIDVLRTTAKEIILK